MKGIRNIIAAAVATIGLSNIVNAQEDWQRQRLVEQPVIEDILPNVERRIYKCRDEFVVLFYTSVNPDRAVVYKSDNIIFLNNQPFIPLKNRFPFLYLDGERVNVNVDGDSIFDLDDILRVDPDFLYEPDYYKKLDGKDICFIYDNLGRYEVVDLLH